MMKNKTLLRLFAAVRWVIYVLLISIAFVSSTIGTNIKPLLLIPIAVGISMNEEDEFVATFTGILCGLLIDISCGKLFGYNAILLVAFCVMTSLLFTHLLRPSVINMTLIVIVCAFIQGSLDYLFYYAMWGHSGVSYIFFNITVPSWIYTSISAIFVYIIMRFIHKIKPKRTQNIEENNDIRTE